MDNFLWCMWDDFWVVFIGNFWRRFWLVFGSFYVWFLVIFGGVVWVIYECFLVVLCGCFLV